MEHNFQTRNHFQTSRSQRRQAPTICQQDSCTESAHRENLFRFDSELEVPQLDESHVERRPYGYPAIFAA
jgi:hypothetical protein